MKNLKKVDKIAYIRYASVCQSFEDLEEFSEELEKLLKNKVNDDNKFESKHKDFMFGHKFIKSTKYKIPSLLILLLFIYGSI